METVFALKFHFRGKLENAFVRAREATNGLEYTITLMNGELERLLFNNNVFKEAAGKVQIDLPSQNSDLARLKCAIGYALGQFLKESSEATTAGNGTHMI